MDAFEVQQRYTSISNAIEAARAERKRQMDVIASTARSGQHDASDRARHLLAAIDGSLEELERQQAALEGQLANASAE
ncbi:hypothetical protein LB518_11740 [Mesorhizobium sp. BR1-1-16]|uniref:hypothetical protein n=1 Tax=Mesorhizobium sp. BR1-1-16 TaxID=2876653 RepID=UPI001CCFE6BC|nr:hypothetical protein [Mesorhizobium sp. BR1-1-16]MBZ9936969.1 hypothetical protein [Mesorhizobium sp. BR1-1-16]